MHQMRGDTFMKLRKITCVCLVNSWALFDRNLFGLLHFTRTLTAFLVLKLARIVYTRPVEELDQLLDQKKKAVANGDFRKAAQIRNGIDTRNEAWLRAQASDCFLDTFEAL